jgi:hypothetical protein
MSFQFDTSSYVRMVPSDVKSTPKDYLRWPDLSPFEQGYVEAMFAEVHHNYHWATGDFGAPDDYSAGPAFRHLAPETLARIRKDCAAIGPYSASKFYADSQRQGAHFWFDRNHVAEHGEHYFAKLPPLAPYLGNDGKVYLRESV